MICATDVQNSKFEICIHPRHHIEKKPEKLTHHDEAQDVALLMEYRGVGHNLYITQGMRFGSNTKRGMKARNYAHGS